MRCQKCGRGLGLIHKSCPKCGIPVPPEQRKRFLISSFIWFSVFVILTFVIYYFYYDVQTYTAGQNFLGSVMVAILATFGLFLLYKFIRFAVRRPVWGVIILAIWLVPAVGGLIIYLSTYQQLKDLVAIQTNLADITSAKLLGDSIIKKGKLTDSSFNDVKADVAAASEKLIGLSVPDEFKNYQATVILWSVRVSIAADQTSGWKNLKNQPDDFPIILSDTDAIKLFNVGLQTIADLKQAGADAIQNKDREAMRFIAAKLLVQEHWLNAILYSQTNKTAFNPVIPAFAASQQVPSVGKGMDVTCLVCNYPDFYKVHWTDKLRQQYGCEVRCQPKKVDDKQTATEENTSTNDETAKYVESLAAFTYKDTPKRAVCIGTGGTSTGGATTRKFCVEEAVQSTNEIAASAVGFAANTESLTADQWNNEYEDIDFALAPEDTTGEIGTAPSQPSVEDGHREGGMGTVQQGEPIATPKPKTPTSKGVWDGRYTVTYGQDCDHPGLEFTESIENNRFLGYNDPVLIIPPSGYFSYDYGLVFWEMQFTRVGDNVTFIWTDRMYEWKDGVRYKGDIFCTKTGKRISTVTSY